MFLFYILVMSPPNRNAVLESNPRVSLLPGITHTHTHAGNEARLVLQRGSVLSDRLYRCVCVCVCVFDIYIYIYIYIYI